MTHVKRGSKEYVFGQRYYYWCGQSENPYHVIPRYGDLKEEMLEVMDAVQFHKAHFKASRLLRESNAVKRIVSKWKAETADPNLPEMEDGLPLSVENVLSIVLYADYDALAHDLKMTYHKTSECEGLLSQKGRHSAFAHWARILTETVAFWGTPLRFCKIDTLYTNTGFMYFSLFTAGIVLVAL